jgi:hypothetical protein
MDHDQRFKSLIQEFFGDFLRLFFADWAARFDLSTVEWLDKEIMPDPPEGTRHLPDLVARIHTRERIDSEQWLALIHIEIEAPDRATLLKPRLPRYYIHLRDKYEMPVLPIVIYLKVGMNGIGVDVYEERFWELSTLRFSYLYVGLPGLDAVQYMHGDNWLGVALAALMRIPPEKVAWLGAEALRRLTEAPLTEQQRFLLGECVQAYLPLDEKQRQVYDRLVTGEPFTMVQAMNQTVYEKGIEKGLQKGLQNALLRIGGKQFGVASSDVETRIRAIHNVERLEALTERVLDAQNWDELLHDA